MPPLGRFDPEQSNRQVQQVIANITEEPEQIDEICKIRDQFRVEEGSRYYALLQAYLNEELNLTEAMEQLFGPIYEGAARFNANDSKSYDLWHSLIHSAKRTSYRDVKTHQLLVDFLREIKNAPYPANITAAQDHEAQHDRVKSLFSELHGFSYVIQYAWSDTPGHGSGCTVPELHAWANLNFFAANVTKEEVCNLSVYCILAMRAALEEDVEKQSSRVFRRMTAVQMYDALVPAAGVWVFSLGKKLYDMEVDLSPKHLKAPPVAYGGEFYSGPSGFNKERWGLWKQRFGEISVLTGLSDETRSVAREAFMIMEQNGKRPGEKRYDLRSRKRPEEAPAS